METGNSAPKPPNPFNPGSPVDPSDFVGRVQELENFRQKLMQTASGSLASMAVAGGYGVGKTSFLHKCKAIAEEQDALTVYFSLNEVDDLTRETLAKMLILRIQEKVHEEVILKRISSEIFRVLGSIRIKTEGGVEFGLAGRVSEPDYPNLQSALLAAWAALKKSKKAMVFLIDEARVLEKNRADLILYLRAVLEHLQLSRTPVMIVPAGKLSISGPSGTGFSPLVRTFPPVVMENFNRDESRAFINKKLEPVGMRMTENALNRVVEITEGHPFVLSAYLHDAYSKLQSGETELKELHLKAADLEFVSRTLSPFFSRFYDQTGKTSNKILSLMAANANGESSLSELSEHLGKDQNEISPHLGKLVQDGAIVRTGRGRYKLFHHLLGEYIKRKHEQQ